MRQAGPGRLKLRPEDDDAQHRQALDALDRQAQKLLRGRVDPVHVLVVQKDRRFGREPLELVDQHFQGPPFLALRRQVERRIAITSRDAEQRGDQRHRLMELVCAARQQDLQLVEPHLGRIIAGKTGRALQLLDHRMQRAGLVIGGAIVGKPQVGLI